MIHSKMASTMQTPEQHLLRNRAPQQQVNDDGPCSARTSNKNFWFGWHIPTPRIR
jgi:hypothetical protein